jgi:hypothetical protein
MLLLLQWMAFYINRRAPLTGYHMSRADNIRLQHKLHSFDSCLLNDRIAICVSEVVEQSQTSYTPNTDFCSRGLP